MMGITLLGHRSTSIFRIHMCALRPEHAGQQLGNNCASFVEHLAHRLQQQGDTIEIHACWGASLVHIIIFAQPRAP